MSDHTKIEWADATFNPWVGCAKVSAACTNCYAESWARRTGSPELWRGERRRTSRANWLKPLRWNRERPGTRVFCASLADVFDQGDDADQETTLDLWRDDLFELIAATPTLIWMLLTKRPGNAAHWFNRRPVPDNVWVGTTVETQEWADERIPHLLRIPARVRFLSCEPLLGPVTLTYLDERATPDGEVVRWVIAGGESGPRARPTHPDWIRSLRDQCQASGTPFYFKQWGEWLPDSEVGLRADPDLDYDAIVGGHPIQAIGAVPGNTPQVLHGMHRVGKARAGRDLDGRTWDGVPT